MYQFLRTKRVYVNQHIVTDYILTCKCSIFLVVDDDGCWWCMPTMGAVATQWLIVVCFVFICQFVADVGCLLHSLSMCCSCSWQDSTWECNVMMQCASHHICITLSGWLLFVIHCCLLLYVVVVVCSWCLLDVVVLVYLLMMDVDGYFCCFQLLCILSQIVANCIPFIFLFLLSWQIFRYNTRSWYAGSFKGR